MTSPRASDDPLLEIRSILVGSTLEEHRRLLEDLSTRLAAEERRGLRSAGELGELVDRLRADLDATEARSRRALEALEVRQESVEQRLARLEERALLRDDARRLLDDAARRLGGGA